MNNKISKLCTLTSFEDIDQKGILIKELHLQSSYEISTSLFDLVAKERDELVLGPYPWPTLPILEMGVPGSQRS